MYILSIYTNNTLDSVNYHPFTIYEMNIVFAQRLKHLNNICVSYKVTLQLAFLVDLYKDDQ